jgi:hypothetical protein
VICLACGWVRQNLKRDFLLKWWKRIDIKLFSWFGRMRGASRIVIIPYTVSVELTAEQQIFINSLEGAFAKYLPLFLGLMEKDIEKFSESIDDVRTPILSRLKEYQVTESVWRIATNIAIVYTFAVWVRTIQILNPS